jgi:tRNA nucleotidyltransferase (CCA-adding enzyme)
MHLAEVPSAVRWIVRTLEEAGFETWTVGGAVRDALAGKRVGDWDLTTRATPPQMRRHFPRTVPVGVAHGTVGILDREGTLYEVTTFRRDVETTGRHAVVAFAETLDEDLARRDFTINAVAWHPLREVVHDPFGGVADMEARVLRTVGDPAARFAEDYLRVLRALRFAGVFGLRIEDECWRELTRAVEHLGILSPERIREEMEKVLSNEAPPSRTLSLYVASGALAMLYPEIDRMREVDRGDGGGDWFSHTLRTLDLLAMGGPPLQWATLLHGIGAPGPHPDDPPFPGDGREAPGVRTLLRAAALLERVRSSNARIREVSELARAAALPPQDHASDPELRRWLAMAGRGNLNAILRIWEAGVQADAAHGGPWSWDRYGSLAERLRAMFLARDPLTIDELAIGGKDLVKMGSRPGPHFGDILESLLEQVLDDPSRNEPGYLAGEAQLMLEESES